jgi:ribosomal protein S12 methylthiotransferase accessory factor
VPAAALDALTDGDERDRRAQVRVHALAGYELDLSGNRIALPVPAVCSLAVLKDGGLGYPAFAASASLDPRAAAEAAICEAMTYLPQLPQLPQRLRAPPPGLAEMARDFTRSADLPTSPVQHRMGLHAVRTIVPGLLPIESGWCQQRALRLPRLLAAASRATAAQVSQTADLRLVPHPVP